MRDSFFAAAAYIKYWLLKEDQFSQQSPFVFRVYSDLLRFLSQSKNGNPAIEVFRKSLQEDTSEIEVLDLGAGSKKIPKPQRLIGDIARYSTSGIKFSQVYQFFCGLTPAHTVIELGTCLGISTRYLSLQTKGTLFTLEGSPEIQQVAKRAPYPERTSFELGDIRETLPLLLQTLSEVDFALIDANHTYEGTIFAFRTLLTKAQPQTIFAVSDIHWTSEMEKVWTEIKAEEQVRLTMDFFECGIVFFDFPGEKTDLILHI